MSDKIKSFTLFSLLIFLLSTALTAQKLQGLDLRKLSEFNDYISSEVESGRIAGAEFLVARNDTVVMHNAVGFADLSTKKRLAKNSIYFIQSMTKPIISVAIMQLYERGLIDLNDEVAQYIPEVEQVRVAINVYGGLKGPTVEKKNPITIAQ